MFHVVESLCAPRLPHVAVLTLISIGFAGCSADMSTRLSQDSFSNPFAKQAEATASVPAPVERRELPQYARPQTQTPQYQSSALPPPTVSAPQSYPSTGNEVSGGGRGLSSYA
ncbi:MAG: peptidoglycan-binding LysM, partial [Pseudolabrys sp.]